MRVVTTGIGLVSPIGETRERTWENALAGIVGLQPNGAEGSRWYAGRVRDDVTESDAPTRAGAFLLCAARDALSHAGIDLPWLDPERVAVIIGTCSATPPEPLPALTYLITQGLADLVANRTGCTGPRIVVNTACAAGASAIALGAELIRAGDVDLVLAGGADELSPHTVTAFSSVKALAGEPCAPYTRSSGISLGEGAALLVLEAADHARCRGAREVAELLGYGLSADAFHSTAPEPTGLGAELSVRRALAMAGCSPRDIAYVNTHGTGTKANDEMEASLLARLLGERLSWVPVSATKSMTGHALGASAALEAGITAMAVHHDRVPPTASARVSPRPLDVVPRRGRPHDVPVALSTSHAFGGNNVALVLGKARGRALVDTRREPVVVSGIGAVGRAGIGVEAWFDCLLRGETVVRDHDRGNSQSGEGDPMDTLDGREYTSPKEWRRFDALARQSLAATSLALQDAGLCAQELPSDEVGVLIATSAGPLDSGLRLSAQTDRGAAINPLIAANTPMSSTAGHIGRRFGWRGPTSTVVSGGISALVALAYAAALVGTGQAVAIVVVAGDVGCERLVRGFTEESGAEALTGGLIRPFDRQADGTVVGGASVALLVEPQAAVAARRGRVYCSVAGWAGRGATSMSVADRAAAQAAAMRAATVRAAINITDVDHVVAAASGIPEKDAIEACAIAETFGRDSIVTAPKSIFGETIAASGAVNVIAAALALQRSVVAPTAHLCNPADRRPRYATNAVAMPVRYVVANARTERGTLASAVLGQP